MLVGMSIPISNPRQADLAAQYRPKDTTAPKPSRWYEQTYGQPGNNVQNKAAKAALGTFLGALDVPVQAIGGMHRDALAGNTLGEQSPGSRAVQNYGQQVGGLWSDVFKPGQGQTPLFQPREFEAAGEAAVDRFGLEGGAALAARGGATALDLLTGLVAGGVGGVGRGTVRAAGDAVKAGSDVAKMSPAVRQAYLSSIGRTLRHGSRDPNSFDVVPTGGQTFENFFDANFFATTSKGLAQSSGYGAGRHHRVKMPLETARNLNMLDLYPGAPSVRDQFPHIADELAKMGNFGSDISVTGSRALTKDPAALQRGLDDPRRYLAFSRGNSDVPSWNDWFSERGINAVRHQSGAYTNNNVTEPVFAFFNPQGLSAVPNRSAGEVLRGAADNTKEYLTSLLSRLRGGQAAENTQDLRGAFQ